MYFRGTSSYFLKRRARRVEVLVVLEQDYSIIVFCFLLLPPTTMPTNWLWPDNYTAVSYYHVYAYLLYYMTYAHTCTVYRLCTLVIKARRRVYARR